MPVISDADCLIFDIDGVLLDCDLSFPILIRRAVESEWLRGGGEVDCPGYSDDLQRLFKRHGSFNDDYDIAWILLLIAHRSKSKKLSEALPSVECISEIITDCTADCVVWGRKRLGETVCRDKVRALCAALYYGDLTTPGLYNYEKVLLPIHWRQLPLPVGIYTGRNAREWDVAKKRLQWDDFPDERIIHADSGVLKPSPDGLALLCQRFGCKVPLFFGDTASDKKSQEAFGKGYFVAIGNLLPEVDWSFDSPPAALKKLLDFAIQDERVD